MANLNSELNDCGSAGAESQRPATHDIKDEQRLFEYLDGLVPASEAREIEAHLAGCPTCTGLARQWQELDSHLSSNLGSASLSPDFASQVWRKIESASIPAPEAAALRKPKEFELQWAEAWARHRGRFLWTQLPAALDTVGYAFATTMGIFVLYRLVTRFSVVWAAWIQTAQTMPQQWIVAFGLGLGGLVLLVALGITAKRPLARLMAAL